MMVGWTLTGARRRSLEAVAVLALAVAAWPAMAQSGPAGAAPADDPATVPPPRLSNPADPLEGLNRKTFAFNEGLDRVVLKPVAEGYKKAVPEPVRTGIGNVFGNFTDAWSAVNQLLQGKLQFGLEMGMRVAVNTVFGLGGIVDVASDAGLEKRSEDLGQTFGKWGFGPGPYLVLPVLGPSDVRDTIALPADSLATPALLANETSVQVGITVLKVVDARASLLVATGIVDSIALDKYAFIRDAYLARRRNLVYDGDPPEEKDPNADPAPETKGDAK
jgi:phospholipid-binding lipoprotein MlaA